MTPESVEEHPLAVDDPLRRTLQELEEAPADDLWERVAAAVANDARRRRRRRVALGLAVAAVVLGLLALQRGVLDTWVLDWRVLEVVETGVMVALVLAIRPLLDDVGHEFRVAAFGGAEETAARLAPLLDLAWNLVFVGLTLVTVEWSPSVPIGATALAQLEQSARRVAVLLMAMGILHAVTFLVLPVAGVAWRAATTRRPMPRWVVVGLVVVALPAAFLVVNLLLGLIAIGVGD